MGKVRAEMAGKVVQVCVSVGDSVSEDQDLIVIESMKMQIPVGSPEDGTVARIHVVPDQFVNEGDPIVDLA